VTLRPDETEVVGIWKTADGHTTKDQDAQRIEVLVREHLKPIAVSSSGWEKLFQDPADGRFWELTYPDSNLHGGGPPKLAAVIEEEARRKYAF
jgi:Immunity protein 27